MLNSTIVKSSLSGAVTPASLWHASTTTHTYAFAFANKYGQGGTWGNIG
jgi:hypothetical protein